MLEPNVPRTSCSPYPAFINSNYGTHLARFFKPGKLALQSEECETNDPIAHRILIAEEDGPLARLLSKGLLTKSVSIDIADSVERATELIENQSYDVIIMSLDVTNATSLGLLQRIRSTCPTAGVLVLTHRGNVQESVATLDHGADDYLPKPFSLLELTARVRVLQRRKSVPSQPTVLGTRLILNRTEFRVQRSGRTIELTPREFALLEYLVENPGSVLSRSTLMTEVWNMPHDANTNIVDVYMKYLRDKLDAVGEESLIRTVRGVGYVLNSIN